MSKSIFVNLPVKDVNSARSFYERLGFKINEQFTSEQNVLVVIEDDIMLMLVVEDFFKQNTGRGVADTKAVSEVSVAIQVETREAVDKTIAAALAAGGKSAGQKLDDEVMYSLGFTDLDGHQLDIFCMAA